MKKRDVHYEPDAEKIVEMRATHRTDHPLPPQQHSAAAERGVEGAGVPPLQDVRESDSEASYTEAGPDDAYEPGH